ncbi:unnamed protein product [Withania somnifera]
MANNNQHFGPSSTFISLFLVLLLHIHYAKSDLKLNHYLESCPRAEEIIKDQVTKLYHKHGNTAVSWIRNLFHDCMVKSCDASILLDTTKEQKSEKTSERNFGMRNFKYIETIKEALESECPNTVSCADIVALSARDGIVMLGGPHIEMKTGRRDSKESYLAEVENFIPNHNDSMLLVLSRFKSVGVDAQGTVALLGAHSVGRVHCVNIVHVLYPTVDPTLDHDYANYLKTRCPSPQPDRNVAEFAEMIVKLQWVVKCGPTISFGSKYLSFCGEICRDNSYFNDRFAKALIILSENNPLRGDQGEIRKVRRHVNK